MKPTFTCFNTCMVSQCDASVIVLTWNMCGVTVFSTDMVSQYSVPVWCHSIQYLNGVTVFNTCMMSQYSIPVWCHSIQYLNGVNVWCSCLLLISCLSILCPIPELHIPIDRPANIFQTCSIAVSCKAILPQTYKLPHRCVPQLLLNI